MSEDAVDMNSDATSVDSKQRPAAPPTAKPAHPPLAPGELMGLERQSSWPNVIGIATIIIASIAILANLWGVVSGALLGGLSQNMAGVFNDEAMAATMQRQWILQGVSGGVKFFTAILLLLVGIHVVRRQAVARKSAMIYGCIQILVAGGFSIAAAMLQAESMRVMMNSQAAQGGPNPGVQMSAFAPVIAIVTFLFSFAFSGGYAVFLLIWFNRTKIRREIATWTNE